jgi:hypothetical protein
MLVNLGSCTTSRRSCTHRNNLCGAFKWYHHINFTTKAKGVDHGITTNLFFAEVICKKGELEELVPSCLRILEPSDNGMYMLLP